MKKIAVLSIILLVMCSGLFAARVYIPDYGMPDVFSSPARLSEKDITENFGLSISAGSDISALSYLANPTGHSEKMATELIDFLNGKDDAWLISNYSQLKDIFSFDGNFPTQRKADAETAAQIRSYLSMKFPTVSAENKTWAVSRATDLGVFNSSSTIGGDISLLIDMNSLHVKNGFGWNVGLKLGVIGSDSLFSHYTSSSYTYGSEVASVLYGNIGYAIPLHADRLYLGISVNPRAIFRVPVNNRSLTTGRLESSLVTMFSSSDLVLGVGGGVNAGMLWNFTDSFSVNVDVRNIVDYAWYWSAPVDSVTSGVSFKLDGDYYSTPIDLGVTFIFRIGNVEIEAGAANFIPEQLKVSSIAGYKFNWFNVPKAKISSAINEELTLALSYASEKIKFEIDWKSLSVALSTKVTKGYLGIEIGYVF